MQEAPRGRRSLSDALRAVAREDATRGVSMDVEAQLLKEVRAIARARQRRRRMVIAAIAAAVIAVVSVGMWHQRTCCRPVEVGPAEARPDLTAKAEVATAFLPLPYSSVPTSRTHLVRLEVSDRALVSFGLALPASFASANARTVLADVVVGDDGLARAVRFVRPLSDRSSR